MRIVTLFCAVAFLLAFLASVIGWKGAVAIAAGGLAWGVAESVWPAVFKWPRTPPPKPVDPDALRDDPVF